MATKVRGARRRPRRPLGPSAPGPLGGAGRIGAGDAEEAGGPARGSPKPRARIARGESVRDPAGGAGGSRGGTPGVSGGACKVCAGAGAGAAAGPREGKFPQPQLAASSRPGPPRDSDRVPSGVHSAQSRTRPAAADRRVPSVGPGCDPHTPAGLGARPPAGEDRTSEVQAQLRGTEYAN